MLVRPRSRERRPRRTSKLGDSISEKLTIRTLLLEGGSVLNGAFAREDLIDELSLITAPVTADPDDLPLFSKSSMYSWKLESVSGRSGALISKYSKQKDC